MNNAIIPKIKSAAKQRSAELIAEHELRALVSDLDDIVALFNQRATLEALDLSDFLDDLAPGDVDDIVRTIATPADAPP
jgi:hypothetical protein